MDWTKEEIREYNKNYVSKNKERLKQQQLDGLGRVKSTTD
jgi:hypothetical protein